MKIGVYNPYLDSLGGGERYTLALASHWSNTHTVHIFWDDHTIQKDVKERLNINLSKVKFVRNIFRGRNVINKLYATRNYDLIVYLSDGSIPLTFAQSTILIFQHPFQSVGGKNVWNQLKLQRIAASVCYSRFTKFYLDKEYGIRCTVIYPPVATEEFTSATKENMIVNVGRFSSYDLNKKQKEMVGFFRTLHKKLPDWKLCLVGGLLPQDRAYFEEVKRMAEGLPISLYPNAPFSRVRTLYSTAKIYWHAAGFGVNEKKDPAGLEHFGISTVEAMASGCVPIVYDGGGQREIVRNGKDGFFWRSEAELLEKTARVADDPVLCRRMHDAAIGRARRFGEKQFFMAFDRLIGDESAKK